MDRGARPPSSIFLPSSLMRLSSFPAALALGLGLLLGCRQAPPNGLALVGATLIDGTGGPALVDAAIVVREGRIESVGTRVGFDLPARTTEVDVRGRWIIPGLVDAHAHIAEWALPRYLAWGVTTVRDVHGSLDSILALRARVNDGAVPGPRIYSAGAMIDGLPTTYSDALGANGAPDARKAVDRLVNAGADYIKIYTRVDRVMLNAVLDEARTFNLKVSAHLGLTDAITAARGGVSSIEHLTGVPEAALPDPSSLVAAHYRSFFGGWTAFEKSWAGLDSAALTRVAKALAGTKVTLVPTLVLHETFSRLDDSTVLADAGLKAVPELERRRWNVPEMITRAGWSAADFAAFRRSRPMQDFFLRKFHAAGGRIAAGTDASNQLLVPGYSQHRELELLVAAGISPLNALLAATRSGALLLGVDSLGLLAPGKVADLVVLTRNPLNNIRNSLAIDRVMSRGRLLWPDSIRASW
ncbi:MAG: amidohydrolase family protein [Gemmatimonadales bacterium]|nr:amidohydrolase family protein [Gemmatimonadales bacterium]